jgi:hypothetical protein
LFIPLFAMPEPRRSRLYVKLCIIAAVAFFVVSGVSAFAFPWWGIPLWGKGILMGLLFTGLAYSFHKEAKGDDPHSKAVGQDDAVKAHPERFE